MRGKISDFADLFLVRLDIKKKIQSPFCTLVQKPSNSIAQQQLQIRCPVIPQHIRNSAEAMFDEDLEFGRDGFCDQASLAAIK